MSATSSRGIGEERLAPGVGDVRVAARPLTVPEVAGVRRGRPELEFEELDIDRPWLRGSTLLAGPSHHLKLKRGELALLTTDLRYIEHFPN